MDYTIYLVYCGSMIKVALTGNIASGKSLVEEYLKNKGFKTLCLDKVTADIYKFNESFKNKLKEIVNTSSKIEISKLVFNDRKLLRTLESIIYPLILDKMQEFFNKNACEKVIIVDAPTLFESGFEKYFDRIIFVSANKNIRLKRLQERNNLSTEDALKRIEAQIKEEDKISKSDYIIKNEGTMKELQHECDKITEVLSTLL